MQTEETKNADRSGPTGLVTAVALSSAFGWIFLVALTSLMTEDIPSLLDPGNDAGGYAVAQALHTAFRRRYGGGAGALLCLGVVAVTTFLCGSGCITTNSRMGYAFSRDGAMPFSRFWYRVNKQEVPFNVVWLSVAVAFVMALTVRDDLLISELSFIQVVTNTVQQNTCMPLPCRHSKGTISMSIPTIFVLVCS